MQERHRSMLSESDHVPVSEAFSVRQNILANYVSMLATSLVPFLAIPWYVGALGPKMWGLVSFVALLQVIMGMIDAGVSQTLTREFAVQIHSADDGRKRAIAILRAFERGYWIVGLCVAIFVSLFAGTIAKQWLILDGVSVDSAIMAVYGAAAIFFVQFPKSVYRGVLVGGQWHIALSKSSVVTMLLRHVVGVLLVMKWPSLAVYLAWHVFSGLVETLSYAMQSKRRLGFDRMETNIMARDELMRLSMRAMGMSVATLLGVLSIQMDKIMLSRLVSLEEFGYYAIAATLALAPLQFTGPVIQVVFPRIVLALKNPAESRHINLRLFLFLACLVSLGAGLYAIAGEWFIQLWLRHEAMATVVHDLVSVLLIGTAACALSEIGHARWLAEGNIKMVAWRNGLALVFSIVAIPLAVAEFGLVGATFSWVMNNLLVLVLSLGWIRTLRLEGGR